MKTYPWLDYLFKPIGWILGILAVIFLAVALAVGYCIGIVVFLLLDGYRIGSMHIETYMRSPDLTSPWAKPVTDPRSNQFRG